RRLRGRDRWRLSRNPHWRLASFLSSRTARSCATSQTTWVRRSSARGLRTSCANVSPADLLCDRRGGRSRKSSSSVPTFHEYVRQDRHPWNRSAKECETPPHSPRREEVL